MRITKIYKSKKKKDKKYVIQHVVIQTRDIGDDNKELQRKNKMKQEEKSHRKKSVTNDTDTQRQV